MKWWWVRDPDVGGWKSHCFPNPLKNRLLRNLENRGLRLPKPGEFCALHVFEGKFELDAGGSCFADEPKLEYKVDELAVIVPVTQFEMWFDGLYKQKKRLELGVPYYKVHTWLHCLCLLPRQLMDLLERMEVRLEEANALAELENQRFNQMLRDAKARKVPLAMQERVVKEMKQA